MQNQQLCMWWGEKRSEEWKTTLLVPQRLPSLAYNAPDSQKSANERLQSVGWSDCVNWLSCLIMLMALNDVAFQQKGQENSPVLIYGTCAF